VSRPRLLLLDEPLASLDLRSQQEVSQLVADLQAEHGFTVVLVTHDINPVLGVTDRVMYVAGGGVSVGPPEEVITSASLSRLYQADVEVLTDSRAGSSWSAWKPRPPIRTHPAGCGHDRRARQRLRVSRPARAGTWWPTSRTC
jgi:zinc/manganese transport system ATP-binding protein